MTVHRSCRTSTWVPPSLMDFQIAAMAWALHHGDPLPQTPCHDEPMPGHWFCGRCPYGNVGEFCTKCGAPRYEQRDLAHILDEAMANLPQAEQDEYRRCQQSVVDARRSANRIEGQLYIG